MKASHIICVPIAPIRAESGDSSEMVTQALFGELLTLLEENGDWIKVRLQDDGYEGWMDRKQVLAADSDWVSQITGFGFVQNDLVRVVRSYGEAEIPLRLTRGCRMPLIKNDAGESVLSPGPLGVAANEEIFTPEMTGISGIVVAETRAYLGAPYLWGGKTPWGIDCSGLTQMVFRLCGEDLPRDSAQQAAGGEEIIWKDRFAGDLAFFSRNGGKITHVGILTGRDTVIHASGQVREDEIKDGLIQNNDDKNSKPHRLICIRRYLTK